MKLKSRIIKINHIWWRAEAKVESEIMPFILAKIYIVVTKQWMVRFINVFKMLNILEMALQHIIHNVACDFARFIDYTFVIHSLFLLKPSNVFMGWKFHRLWSDRNKKKKLTLSSFYSKAYLRARKKIDPKNVLFFESRPEPSTH